MAQALIYFLHLESELRVAEDTGMFYCVLVSINIPFEPLDRILFHMNFKQKAFGINTRLLCFIFLLSFRSITLHLIINRNLFKSTGCDFGQLGSGWSYHLVVLRMGKV